jgi:hypothetical protein
MQFIVSSVNSENSGLASYLDRSSIIVVRNLNICIAACLLNTRSAYIELLSTGLACGIRLIGLSLGTLNSIGSLILKKTNYCM